MSTHRNALLTTLDNHWYKFSYYKRRLFLLGFGVSIDKFDLYHQIAWGLCMKKDYNNRIIQSSTGNTRLDSVK